MLRLIAIFAVVYFAVRTVFRFILPTPKASPYFKKNDTTDGIKVDFAPEEEDSKYKEGGDYVDYIEVKD